MEHNDILTIAKDFETARSHLELGGLKGYSSIKAEAFFNVNTGDMNLHWEIYNAGGVGEEGITVKGQYLCEVVCELTRRRVKNTSMAPVCLPRVRNVAVGEF